MHRLYTGQTRFDFIGRRRIWFAISAIIIGAGIISLGVRGFNFGIEFKGGTSWTVQYKGISASQAQTAVEADGLTQPVVEVLGGRDPPGAGGSQQPAHGAASRRSPPR